MSSLSSSRPTNCGFQSAHQITDNRNCFNCKREYAAIQFHLWKRQPPIRQRNSRTNKTIRRRRGDETDEPLPQARPRAAPRQRPRQRDRRRRFARRLHRRRTTPARSRTADRPLENDRSYPLLSRHHGILCWSRAVRGELISYAQTP